jgi:hypothetical protein
MKLPFSTEEFFEVFARYNKAVVSSTAVLAFGMYEDSALLVTGLFAAGVLLPRRSGTANTRNSERLTGDDSTLQTGSNVHVRRRDAGSSTNATGTSRSTFMERSQ